MKTWPAAGAAVATALFWSPALRGRFLNWDDLPVVTSNKNLDLPAGALVRWAFTTTRNSAYQPGGWLLLAALRRAFGPGPEPIHAASLLSHAAAAVAAYFLALKLLKKPGAAAFAALAFSLHPMHAEILAMAGTTPDAVAAAFVIAAVAAFAYAKDEASWVLLGAAAVTRWLAAFAGPAALAVEPKSWRRAWPLFALGAAPAVAMALAKSSSGFASTFSLAPVARALALFLSHLIFPFGFSPVYVLERQGGGALAVAATAACFAARKRAPGLWRAWLFAAATIAPTALMSEGGRHFYHDRYGYFACLGAALCAGSVFSAALERARWKVPATAAACALAVALGYRAASEARTYRDSATLWRAAALAQPEEPLVFNRLGEALADEERAPCEAKSAFETQRRLDDSPEARSLIGQADALCREGVR